MSFHTKEYLHAIELNKQGGYEHPFTLTMGPVDKLTFSVFISACFLEMP